MRFSVVANASYHNFSASVTQKIFATGVETKLEFYLSTKSSKYAELPQKNVRHVLVCLSQIKI
jgi:hypothetical protein